METPIVAALIAASATIFGAFASLLLSISRKNSRKLDALTIHVDGRLTELLELTRTAAHAEGVKDEQTLARETAPETRSNSAPDNQPTS